MLREIDRAFNGITEGGRIDRISRKGAKYFMSRSDLVLPLANEIKAVLSCRPKNYCISDKFVPAFLEHNHPARISAENA